MALNLKSFNKYYQTADEYNRNLAELNITNSARRAYNISANEDITNTGMNVNNTRYINMSMLKLFGRVK